MSGGPGAGSGGAVAGGVGGGATHIFRSLSSESQKREWSKRLSLRGMRHGGAAGGPGGSGTSSLASSKEVS